MISMVYMDLAQQLFIGYSARMRIKFDNVDLKNADAPFVVYMATNIINGKTYIGATRQGLQNRSKQHISDALKGVSGCRNFAAAIRKYGADNFIWEVISTASSFEGLMQKEFELVDSLKPDYNMCAGGMQSPSGMLGKTHSAETREKLREYGLARIDIFNQYRHLGPQSSRKRVVCLNTGEVFESTVAAAKAKNVNQISLLYVCNRHPKRIATKGLVFRYFGDHLGGKEEADKLLLRKKTRWRAVVCITDDIQFESIVKAASHYQTSTSLISCACDNGYHITKKKLIFRYADSAQVISIYDTEIGKQHKKENAAKGCAAAKEVARLKREKRLVNG